MGTGQNAPDASFEISPLTCRGAAVQISLTRESPPWIASNPTPRTGCRSDPERGTINGLPFVRARWSGIETTTGLIQWTPTASQLGTKYLNSIFVITREVQDAATGAVQADYGQLGTLLIVQTLSLAAGGLAVFAFARHHLRDDRLAAGLALLYLANPSLHGINVRDVHVQAFAVPLLMAAALAFDRRHWGWCAVAVLLVLSCREDGAVAIVGFAVWLALARRRWALGSAVAVGAVLLLAFDTRVVIPHYRGEAWGLDMLRVLAESRIVLNRHAPIQYRNANNMRSAVRPVYRV